MSIRKWMIIIAVTVTLAWPIAWAIYSEQQHEREQARGLVQVQAALEEMSNRIDQATITARGAQRQLRALDARIADLQPAEASERAGALQAADGEGPVDQENEPDPVISADDFRAGLDELFSRESTGSWNQDARREIAAKLESILPKHSAVHSFECRASLCKIELSHETLDVYHQFAQKSLFSETRLTAGGAFSTVLGEADDEGRVVSVIYLAQGSEPLPQIVFTN